MVGGAREHGRELAQGIVLVLERIDVHREQQRRSHVHRTEGNVGDRARIRGVGNGADHARRGDRSPDDDAAKRVGPVVATEGARGDHVAVALERRAAEIRVDHDHGLVEVELAGVLWRRVGRVLDEARERGQRVPEVRTGVGGVPGVMDVVRETNPRVNP